MGLTSFGIQKAESQPQSKMGTPSAVELNVIVFVVQKRLRDRFVYYITIGVERVGILLALTH
jgi:hypothetical protein